MQYDNSLNDRTMGSKRDRPVVVAPADLRRVKQALVKALEIIHNVDVPPEDYSDSDCDYDDAESDNTSVTSSADKELESLSDTVDSASESESTEDESDTETFHKAVSVPFILSDTALGEFVDGLIEKTSLVTQLDSLEYSICYDVDETHTYIAHSKMSGDPIILGDVYKIYDGEACIGVFTVVGIRRETDNTHSVFCQEWITLEDARCSEHVSRMDESLKRKVFKAPGKFSDADIHLCTTTGNDSDPNGSDMMHMFTIGKHGEDSDLIFVNQEIVVVPDGDKKTDSTEKSVSLMYKKFRKGDPAVFTRACVIDVTSPTPLRTVEERTEDELYQYSLISCIPFHNMQSCIKFDPAAGNDLLARRTDAPTVSWVPHGVQKMYRYAFDYFRNAETVATKSKVSRARASCVMRNLWEHRACAADVDEDIVRTLRLGIKQYQADCEEIIKELSIFHLNSGPSTFPIQRVSYKHTLNCFECLKNK